MSRFNKSFMITKNQAFFLKLNNGYGIEISFGPNSYCENFDLSKNSDFPTRFFTYGSDNCQVIIFKEGKNYTDEFFAIHFGEEKEPKNLTPEEVAQIISILSLL